MYCKKCGKKLPDGSKFCGVCGAKQDSKVIQKIEKQNVSKGSEFSLKIPVLLMCIFIAIGVLGWSGYKYMNRPEKVIVGVWYVLDDNYSKTDNKLEFRKDGTLLTGSTVGYWSFVEKNKLRLVSWSEEYTYECYLVNKAFASQSTELMLQDGTDTIYLEKE